MYVSGVVETEVKSTEEAYEMFSKGSFILLIVTLMSSSSSLMFNVTKIQSVEDHTLLYHTEAVLDNSQLST